MRMMKNVLTLAPIEINAAGRRVSPKEHPSWMTFGNGSHLLPVPMEGYFLLKRDILCKWFIIIIIIIIIFIYFFISIHYFIFLESSTYSPLAFSLTHTHIHTAYYIATFYPQKFGVSPTTIETWSAKLHDSKKFVQDYIKTNFADAWKMMNPLAPWRKDLASPAQITRVKKEFPSIVDKLPSTLTKGQASDLITKAVLFKKALSIKSDARRDQIVSSQVNKYVRAITASKPSLPVYIPEKK